MYFIICKFKDADGIEVPVTFTGELLSAALMHWAVVAEHMEHDGFWVEEISMLTSEEHC